MKNTHLAGIIPVANLKSEFELNTPEILLPISSDFTAIQKSVFECALAGCNTIWIVANDDLAPIVKQVVGDWTYDPVYYNRMSKFKSEQRKEIPIYYVPIHPKDRARRDSYGWSVLYGIHSAWRVAYNISHWLIPEKYFISFPMSVYDFHTLREHRPAISSKERNFYLSYENQTVQDGLPLPFTMTGEDFKKCRREINKKTTKEFLHPGPNEQYPSERLPLEERWSARHFSLKEIFGEVDREEAFNANLDWYSDISTWGGYCNFLGSTNSIETPQKALTTPHQHVMIPYTED